MRLDRDRAQLLVIDLQERLLPKIHRYENVLASSGRMLQAARILELPLLATEQYPQGLGKTHLSITSLLGEVEPVEKIHFSCMRHDGFGHLLARQDRQQVIVVGIETHVCVAQTALDMLGSGFEVFVCADAVGSRCPLDHEVAVERLGLAGVTITTTEAVIFELLDRAGTDTFRQVLKLITQDQ
jgi:nicotinamidase-related amidase